jgi:hypothetical protein
MRTAFLILMISACDSGTTNTKSGNGTITISDPTDKATIAATAANPDYSVKFTVANFTLKDPGTCAGAANCGHVHMVIDGTQCNDPAAPGPYNADGAASPIVIGFDYCPAISGAHKIIAELHNDDHSTYTDPSGKAVTTSVDVNVP